MKVLHVIDTIARVSGGPSRSCQGLVAALCKAGVDASLYSLTPGERPWHEGVRKYYNGVGIEAVLDEEKPDIVHIHDLWIPGLHRCAAICRRRGVPYIVAPRGMLEPWSLKQKWLKKRIARWLYQDRDLKCAAALHATAESEAEQFRKLGFKNPIIVSPNGVNVPAIPLSSLVLRPTSPCGNALRRVLFVSRMHPKKGVMELVEAWKLVVSRQSSVVSRWVCELVYTVNGELAKEYEAKVKARVKELGLEDQFVFTGALNDDEKWKAYGRADLFVLPTYSENFGIVVAEALWAGVPVITTRGTPWHELEERKCGWLIDTGVEPLARVLGEALGASLQSLIKMGDRGRKLVEEKYTWDAVVQSVIAWYESVVLQSRAGLSDK